MIKPIFQSATIRVNGERVNYHNYQGKIKVQAYTDEGIKWVIVTPKDFAERYVV